MKLLLGVIVFGLAAFWGWQRYSEQNITNPVYVELRVKHVSSGVELVGVGRMNSESDCERRANEFWKRVLTTEGELEVSTVVCKKDVALRFEELFSNKQSHATYIALDRGNSGERDARLVIYGAPASEVEKICPSFIERLRRNYTGPIRCVQGSVG